MGDVPKLSQKEGVMRRRLLGLFFVFMLFIAALVGRLGWIQLASGGEYSRLAKEQSMFSLPEIAVRGTIYDRNNRPITNATEGFFFIIDERKMDEKAQALISGIGANPSRVETAWVNIELFM